MSRTIQEAIAGANPTPKDGQQIEYLETVEAYNRWAEVYDKDGNFLQGIDTIEMLNLLPHFLSRVADSVQSSEDFKLVDLGCGTGRNTLQLARLAPSEAKIIGLDASPGMLDVARAALKEVGRDVTLGVYDLLSSSPSISELLLSALQQGQFASGIICTLVLEHIPVDKFFEGAARLIRPGGYFLVTNMHAEMGGISQAGFVDVNTGTKIRPTSYAHEVGDVLEAARRVGFEVVGLNEAGSEERVRERRVNEAMVEGLGKRARKWVGVMVWFGVCFRMKST